MWIDNLIELRAKRGNPPYKLISEKSKVPERTVTRIFSRDTENPYIDTVIRIIKYGLDGSVEEVFADTKQVVGDDTLVKSQGEVAVVVATNDRLSVENGILKDKVVTLEAEIELLKSTLQHKDEIIAHKDEIIALHNYYNKLCSNKE